MKLKNHIIATLMLATCSTAMADSWVHVSHKDGKVVSYLLSDNPRVTLTESNDMLFECKGNSVIVPFRALDKFTIEEVDPNAITTAKTLRPAFQLNATTLKASGQEAGSEINIYDAQGKKVAATRVADNGCASVSLEGLTKGVYIVKSSTSTYKILKK